MPRFFSFLGLAMLAVSSLAGCDKTDTAAPSSGLTICAPGPQPPTCFSGVVLADRCWDGILIQVDSQFPIGQPIAMPDSLGNTNVIAATNSADFGSLLNRRGQRIYFTYNTDPNRKATPRACPTHQIPLPVPHLVLGSVSGVPCGVPNL